MRIRIYLCMLSLATVVNCGRPAEPQQATIPTVKRLTRSPPPIRWAAPAPGERLFSASARRVQIIITPGRRKGEQYGWVFSDGTKLERVYHFINNEANQLVAHINELQKAQGFSFGVLYHSCPVKPKTLGGGPRRPTARPSSEFAQQSGDGIDGCGGSTTSGTTGWDGQPGVPPMTEAIVTDALDTSLSTGDNP